MRAADAERSRISPFLGRRKGASPAVDRVRCILVHDDHYLLAQHISRRSGDRWGFVGGRLKAGEGPKTGLRRELGEELRLRVPYLIEVGDWRHREETYRIYGCELERAVRWFDAAELKTVAWFDYAAITELAADARLHKGFELEALDEYRRLFPGVLRKTQGSRA